MLLSRYASATFSGLAGARHVQTLLREMLRSLLTIDESNCGSPSFVGPVVGWRSWGIPHFFGGKGKASRKSGSDRQTDQANLRKREGKSKISQKDNMFY